MSGIQIENIECQLAVAQLKRYISGDDLMPQVLEDLETHLQSCPGCRNKALELKNALLASAGTESPTEAVGTETETTKSSPLDKIRAIIAPMLTPLHKLQQARQPALSAQPKLLNEPGTPLIPERTTNLRIALTSVGLALTLIAMSTVLRDPTRLFGPKAASAKAATAQASNEDKTESNVKEQEATEDTEETSPSSADSTHSSSADDTASQSENTTEDSKAHDDHQPEKTNGTSQSQSDSKHSPEQSGATRKPEDQPKTHSPSSTRSGLSLPGRPTLDDAPVIRAEGGKVTQAPARPQSNSNGTTRRRSTTSNPPRRTAAPRRQTQAAPSRPAQSNPAPSRPSGGVRVYNPDGTLKN